MKFNLAYIERIVQNDQAFVLSLLETLYNECIKGNNDVKFAVKSNDYNMISDIAHRCKSSFRNFGMDDIASSMDSFESSAKCNQHIDILGEKMLKIFEEVSEECMKLIKEKSLILV